MTSFTGSIRSVGLMAEETGNNDNGQGNDSAKPQDWSWIAMGLPIGVAIGISLGVAMDNIGVGIAIGIAVGMALGLAFREAQQRKRK
jgi:hypothetical protein